MKLKIQQWDDEHNIVTDVVHGDAMYHAITAFMAGLNSQHECLVPDVLTFTYMDTVPNTVVHYSITKEG